MGFLKTGIALLLIGVLSTVFLTITSTSISHLQLLIKTQSPPPHIAHQNKIVLSASTSSNLTLIPPDQILVVPVVIVEIIDINSVRVLLNDGMQIVDLIGIKVPSDTSQSRYKKCYGETIESTIQKIALGKKAYMINDKKYHDRDETRKYLFLEDLTFLNLELIKKGVTSANITENYIYREEFSTVRTEAENNSRGVWYDTCRVTPTPTKNPVKQVFKSNSTPTPQSTNLYSRLLVSATPTQTPSPIPTRLPQEAASTAPSPKPSSLNSEILFVLINNYRQSIGKPLFEKDERLCKLAIERGPELYDEIFVTHNVHAGLTKRNLPYWITENMAHYSSEEQVFNWWMGSTIHRRAIESDNKYSCGECFGNSCAQLFTSFTPK